MQLGSLNPLAEMVKLPWASARPVVGPSSTETLEFGTAPDPTMVSCPLIRLAWEVTIAASAARCADQAAGIHGSRSMSGCGGFVWPHLPCVNESQALPSSSGQTRLGCLPSLGVGPAELVPRVSSADTG